MHRESQFIHLVMMSLFEFEALKVIIRLQNASFDYNNNRVMIIVVQVLIMTISALVIVMDTVIGGSIGIKYHFVKSFY
jgi:hypothetical protein